MAFEYLVRAQLERMNPKATTGLWLAEEAFDFAKKRLSEGHSLSVEMDCLITGMGRPTRPSLPAENPHQVLAELYDLLNQTKNLHARFVTTGKLNRDLLECYLKLARFHGWLVGTGSVVVPYNLNQVDQRAVYELEAMFDLVKWDNFKASRRCLLRPQFRNYSKYGVNEPDLVIDDMIVDLKATASGSLDRRDIDKLFKYFALAELDGLKGRRKGGINKLALYFSRFADWLIIDLRNDYPPEKIEKFLEWHRKKRTQKAN